MNSAVEHERQIPKIFFDSKLTLKINRMADWSSKDKKRKRQADAGDQPAKRALTNSRPVKISVQSSDEWTPIIGMDKTPVDRSSHLLLMRTFADFLQHLRMVWYCLRRSNSNHISNHTIMSPTLNAANLLNLQSSSCNPPSIQDWTILGGKRMWARTPC